MTLEHELQNELQKLKAAVQHTELQNELRTLKAAVRHVALELAIWSTDVLEEDGFVGSYKDLAARLAALAKTLMDALERRPDEPDESID
jgi:hypothetical protein